MENETEILITKFENDIQKRSRMLRLLLVTDQFFNVLVWNGSQDETISSHIHRKQQKGTANLFDNLICKFLHLIENKHCFLSKGE